MLENILPLIGYLIIVIGIVNAVHLSFFLIGSNIYNLKEYRKRKQIGEKPVFLPSFTVLIPAHNEENAIERCLDSVLKTSYPLNLVDIIVVDDGSTDGTVANIEKYCKKNVVGNVLVISQPNQGKANALNNALIKYVHSDLVMCLDADSSIHPDALKEAAWYFQDERVAAMAANVKIYPSNSILNLTQKFEYLLAFQTKRALTLYNLEFIIGGIGSVFRRDILELVSYYDTNTITEDIDLTMKILCLGAKRYRVIYGVRSISYTESVIDFKGLMLQRYRWKYGMLQTFFKNKKLFFNTGKEHNRIFTCLYLPYVIWQHFVLFVQPIFIGYIIYLAIYYHDFATFIGLFLFMSFCMAMNLLAEETICKKERLTYAAMAPLIFIILYIVNYVEYVVLIKSMANLPKIWKSVTEDGSVSCRWEHVARAQKQNN